MNLYSIKHFLIFCAGCFVLVNSSWSQNSFLDPRIRGYIQSSQPGSFYMQDMDVPSLMQGETTLEEVEKPPEEFAPFGVREILFDRKVDPEKYFIGPGDIVGIYLWGELDREYRNYVTPEGHLIIPTIGSLMVADMSLANAREFIKKEVNTKYNGIDATVYLVRPRQFRVYISGLVVNPGLIGANSLEHVSDVIERAGLMYVEKASMIESIQNIQLGRYSDERWYGTERVASMLRGRERSSPYGIIDTDAQIVKKGSSQRSIIIYRGDEQIEVDLLRFRKLGDIDANPYVTMGDRIHVPQYLGDTIISGEASNPDRYEFKPGDRIYDLVLFGGGLTVLADSSRATLVRFKEDGHESYNVPVDLNDALIHNPDDPKYLLKESDRLYIRRKFDYKNMAHVIVDGRIKYPGEYAITSGATLLSELIRMAGGFTEDANIEEARFIRRTSSATQDLEYDRLRRMSRFEMTEEEYDYFRSRARTTQGEVTIDFVQLFNDHDLSYDVTLQHGDNIFIPIKREFVQVSGAVSNPGYVKFEPGKDHQLYIEQAGGYKWDANTRKIRIIKVKTGQRFRPGRRITIEGGDIIHVPEKVPLEKWELFKDSTLLFANVATIIILARQLTK